MEHDLVRWRLNDPADEPRQRWTKVHKVSMHAADLTVCHQLIPDFPYMRDDTIHVPSDAPRCKNCERGE